MQIDISNVINVSVSEAGVGLGEYNTSNLALFTREAYDPLFGTDGYKIYKSPSEVAIDFGTGSNTYAMAVAVFSQKPNILANGGYLVIIPYADTADVSAVQSVTFVETPTVGTFKLNYGAGTTTALNYNDSAATIQTALRLLSGLGSVTVSGSIAAGLVVTFVGVSGPASLMTVSENKLQDTNGINTSVVIATTTVGSTLSTETLATAINRTKGLIQYFGIMSADIPSEANMLLAAAAVQALNKIAFFVSYTAADVEVGGMLDKLRSGSLSQSRGLFYGDDLATALKFMAAYAGRALSTVFSGSNTTQNMHLKALASIDPDPSMTQTLLNKCQAAGVDVYLSIQGVSKVFASGQNKFFDQVYNLLWFIGAIQIGTFNVLAQTGTKIPQTEAGMDAYKSPIRQVCKQAVNNLYVAPGTWTSPDTFGNIEDFYNNIAQAGYYIYSTPVNQQSAADRAARKATLVQIAIKEAGAIDSGNILVSVNA